jgi:hypothetical protein
VFPVLPENSAPEITAIFYFTENGARKSIVSNMPLYLKILALNVKSYATLKSLLSRE